MLLPVQNSHNNVDTQLKSTTPKPAHKQNSQTTHIFKSKLPDIPLTNTIPLHTYCFQKLPQVADRPCLIAAATGKVYTYADTHLASRSFAAGLHSLGIRKGDVIMILLPNSPEFVFSFMAASMLGAAATTANPAYTSTEIMKQIKASKAKMVITHAMQVEKLKQQQQEDDTFVVITVDDPPENCMKFSAVSAEEGESLPEVDIDPDETVALPFSSGTTGLPKGVVLTHKSIVTSTAQVVDGENPNLYYKEEDVVLCLLPLFHIYAMHCVMLCALRRGSAVLLVERFEMNKLLEVIERHRVSVAMVVPPLVLALAKNPTVAEYDLSSIRMVMCGAAPLGKDLEEALQARLPQAVLAQAYGMTESGPVISMSMGFAKNPKIPTKSGSCGSIVRNAELKIVDIESGASLPYNTAGEICVRGQQIMKGYLDDDMATKATIDAEGWLHTGDIGYVDYDHDIFILDRVKEIIKFKGFQVPPAELEGILVNHPSIADAAVVPKRDDVAGEVPVAFVVRSSNGFDLTEDHVKQFIAKQVVFYKRLHGVYFINAIPKSPSGKISRKELKAKLATTT